VINAVDPKPIARQKHFHFAAEGGVLAFIQK